MPPRGGTGGHDTRLPREALMRPGRRLTDRLGPALCAGLVVALLGLAPVAADAAPAPAAESPGASVSDAGPPGPPEALHLLAAAPTAAAPRPAGTGAWPHAALAPVVSRPAPGPASTPARLVPAPRPSLRVLLSSWLI